LWVVTGFPPSGNDRPLARIIIPVKAGIQELLPELIEKRQNQICEAAERLFLKKGFHETTIRDIAWSAG
jgi:AcrR family transcriptional regulator